ncbi:hypothetical protein [Glycomyces harbinensis]|uniref:Uncharacterized protein n=1 Tax=Glycomyces harbinensis TaxID=58114 RepID=A0A1G6Y7E9_9ACTN|nr:hypothetical protein [Glycomyces harbinensis]SDD86359.1 hypothetical protein SAMN05216270_108181 [Glycomyces harbinensis]
MAADYYIADTENGDHIDDPSEDALFILISELERPGNTFVVIRPHNGSPAWSASVRLLPDGGYEVERRDDRRGEHRRDPGEDMSRIANDLTIWLAARFRAAER